ncbi:hypothetical protein [Aeromicrobium sp. Root495]|uniref:hypothetical protein n=1 Tax=Aeromicrobium sp. Root495 TaxID=1736550 RepID=UPI0012E9880D|nr:hypothetical protein [Aeromicrobium sp. Root495]
MAVALLLTTATVLLATNLRDVETEVGDERSRVPVGAVVATPSVRSEPSTSRPTPSPSPTETEAETETAREVADPVRRTAGRPTRQAPERSAATTPTPRPVRTPARPAPSPEPDPLTALVSTILGG